MQWVLKRGNNLDLPGALRSFSCHGEWAELIIKVKLLFVYCDLLIHPNHVRFSTLGIKPADFWFLSVAFVWLPFITVGWPVIPFALFSLLALCKTVYNIKYSVGFYTGTWASLIKDCSWFHIFSVSLKNPRDGLVDVIFQSSFSFIRNIEIYIILTCWIWPFSDQLFSLSGTKGSKRV